MLINVGASFNKSSVDVDMKIGNSQNCFFKLKSWYILGVRPKDK